MAGNSRMDHRALKPKIVRAKKIIPWFDYKITDNFGYVFSAFSAFAADLCHGLDPTNRSYDQAKMREHYISCLESRTITPFPTTTRRVPYHMDTKKISVPIFFECRLPNDKKEYVQCSQCCSWYHPNCAMVPEWAIKRK